MQSMQGAAMEENELRAAIKASTLAAKAQKAALSVLSTAGNMIAFMAIAKGVSFLAEQIDNYIHRNEIAIQKADDLKSSLDSSINSINEKSSSLKSMKDRFIELSQGVDEYGNIISLTTEQADEYKEIVQKLVALNPYLIQGYNSEGEAIINKNTALSETIELLEKEKKLLLDKELSTGNLKTIGEGAVAKREELNGNYNAMNYLKKLDLNTVTGQSARFGKEAAKLFDKESIKAFYDFTDSKAMEERYAEYLQDNIGIFAEHMDEILEKANIDPNSDAGKTLKLYAREWQNLNKELENIDSIYIDEILQKIPQLVNGYDDLTDSQKNFLSEYIRNNFTADDLAKNSTAVVTAIGNMVENISDDERIKLSINKLFSLSDKDLSVTEYADEYKRIIEEIISYLNLTEEEADNLRNNLTKNTNALEEKYNNAVKFTKEKFDDYDPTAFFNENSVNTEKEIDSWLKIAQSAKTASEAESKYLAIKEKLEEKPLSLAETMKELNKLSGGFEKFNKIYSDVADKGTFDFGSITSDDFTNEFSKYADEYDNFIKTITNSPDDIESCQGAFNDLVGAWIDGTGILDKLTEETKDSAIAALEQNGIQNAAEIVTNRLNAETDALALKEQLLAETGTELGNITLEQADNFFNHAIASETARQYLLKLIIEETDFNNKNIDVSKRIDSLEEYATALGNTALAARIAADTEMFNNSPYATNPLLKNLTSYGLIEDPREEYINDYKEELNNTKIEIEPVHFKGSSTYSGSGSGSTGGSGSSSGNSHKTNDKYYNPYQPIIDDLKADEEEFETELNKINSQIEDAYEKGNFELAKELESKYVSLSDQHQNFIAEGAEKMRSMAKDEILPIIYKIAPELEGKTVDQFTNQEIQDIEKRLDDNIIAENNKISDLKNSGASDIEIKSAEKQLTVFKELKETLEEIYKLVGLNNGEGEWSEIWADSDKKKLEILRNGLDKSTESDKFAIDILGSNGNYEGQIAVYRTILDKCNKMAIEYRSKGYAENSEYIQEMQKDYLDAFTNIFEAENKMFDKSKKLKEDRISDLDFELSLSSSKDFDKQEKIINKQLKIQAEIAKDTQNEIERLHKEYGNGTIGLEAYNERVRELTEQQQDAIKSIDDYYDSLTEIEISKIDEEINKITKETDKLTKALENQIDALEKRKAALEENKANLETAHSAVTNLIQEQIEALQNEKDEITKTYDEQLQALQEANDERTKAIELMKLQEALAKAQTQKTALIYHKDKGFVYEADQNEVSNAQDSLNDYLINDQLEKAKESIEEQKNSLIESLDEQIEAWNEYSELWEEAVNAYQDGINKQIAANTLGSNWESQILTRRTGIIKEFEKNYSNVCDTIDNKIQIQIDSLNEQKETIEANSEAEIEDLNLLKTAFEECYDITEPIEIYIENLRNSIGDEAEIYTEKISQLEDFVNKRNSILSALSPFNIADNNNSDKSKTTDKVSVIEQMYANSQKYQYADAETRKILHDENISLASKLGLNTDNFQNGSWIDSNGNNIYEQLDNSVKSSIKTYVKNTYSTEDNTEAVKEINITTKSEIESIKDNTEITQNLTDSTDENSNQIALNNDKQSQTQDSLTQAKKSIDTLSERIKNIDFGKGSLASQENEVIVKYISDIMSKYAAKVSESQIENINKELAEYGASFNGTTLTLSDGSTYRFDKEGNYQYKQANSGLNNNIGGNGDYDSSNDSSGSNNSKPDNSGTTNINNTLYRYVSLSGKDAENASAIGSPTKLYKLSTWHELDSKLLSALGINKSNPYYILRLNNGRQYLRKYNGNGKGKNVFQLANHYADGSNYIPENQLAIVDEEGFASELIISKDQSGRIESLKKGDQVFNASKTKETQDKLNKLFNTDNEAEQNNIYQNLSHISSEVFKILSNNSCYNPAIESLKRTNEIWQSQNINNANNNENSDCNVSIGDIHLHEVQNVDQFVDQICHLMPLRAKQILMKK